MDRKKILINAINNTQSPVFGRGWNVVYYHLAKAHPEHNYTQHEVQEELARSELHQKYRTQKKPKIVKRFAITQTGRVVQVDETMFVQSWVLMIAVDSASRRLWAVAHKRSHTKDDVVEFISAINKDIGDVPTIVADNGKIFEWTAEDLPNKLIHTQAYTSTSNGRIEAYNRFIKQNLTKLLSAGEKMSKELVSRVIANYNASYRGVLRGNVPEANAKTRVTAYGATEIKKQTPLLEAGDNVRISVLKTDLALRKDKTYKPSHSKHWSDSIHTVASVHIPRTPGQAHYYLLQGSDTPYREHDLLKVDTRIRRIIRDKKPAAMVAVPKGPSRTVQKEERELGAVTAKMVPLDEKRKRVPNKKYL